MSFHFIFKKFKGRAASFGLLASLVGLSPHSPKKQKSNYSFFIFRARRPTFFGLLASLLGLSSHTSERFKKEFLFERGRSKKERAFILFSVIFISFLLISLILLIQVFINSRLEIYKSNLEKSKIIGEKNFLETIVEKELNLIESEIEKRNISYAYDFFSLDKDKKEIYRLDTYSKRISYAGYRLFKDKENINYQKYLQKRLDKIYGNNFSITYYKKIKVQEKNIEIRATIFYTCDYSKNIDTLTDAKLKRIWIKEYE